VKKSPAPHRFVVAMGLVAALAGCATTKVHQFNPAPLARVRSQDLKPVSPRTATQLLREAQKEFENANAAQERGDREGALRHYADMLTLLAEANLDPAVFYNLRSEFERILDSTEYHASLAEHDFTERVVGDLAITFPIPERVLVEIEEIQKLYPKNFQAGLDRSAKYVPYARAQLAKAGLPTDLVWLAMVESQFSPKVVSRAGASGMWQFMKSSARRYNLRVDSYVDERFNWQSATHAAAAYLRDLNEMFDGDWALATSAYNMGEYGLERAIASAGGERDLWKLVETSRVMQRETKKFYAKLLATIIVAREPERYGFTLNPQAPEETVRVPIQGSYSLAALERTCGLSSGSLTQLNPDLIRGVTPPTGEYKIAVPVQAGSKVAAALSKLPQVKPVSIAAGATHIVRRGETISGIAKKYRVSSSALMKANRLTSPRRLQAGKRLVIPGSGATSAYSISGSSRAEPSSVSGEGRFYTVRRGDTLSEIAQRFKVSVNELKAFNRLGSSCSIRTGQRLAVAPPPPSAGTAQAATGSGALHVVRTGEYPAKIARLHGVKLDDFLRANNLNVKSTIRVGDKLVVPGKAQSNMSGSVPAGAEKATHKVAKGESASVIASKYGVKTSDFLAWNNLSAKSVLRVGDTYMVYVHDTGRKSGTSGDDKAAPAAKDPKETDQKIVHKTSKGQNPTTIARRYGVKVSDLYKWNDWDKDLVLQIGQDVIIYKK